MLATRHHRVTVVEIMGHKTGWLADAARSLASGINVMSIPEIPYSIDRRRRRPDRAQPQGQEVLDHRRPEGALSPTGGAGSGGTQEGQEQHNGEKGRRRWPGRVRTRPRRSRGPRRCDRRRQGVRLLPRHRPWRWPPSACASRRGSSAAQAQTRLTALGHTQRGDAPRPPIASWRPAGTRTVS
ncbi:MAG: 6-phosphofructokinase [Proteobacteria bacterium]|nr:6-phosphofructokinase [Pseudomonadota bacterium]